MGARTWTRISERFVVFWAGRYFNEEAETAKDAVTEAVRSFDTLVADLGAEQKKSVLQSNGLKVHGLAGRCLRARV